MVPLHSPDRELTMKLPSILVPRIRPDHVTGMVPDPGPPPQNPAV
jgi:hypothetical protein